MKLREENPEEEKEKAIANVWDTPSLLMRSKVHNKVLIGFFSP